MNNPIQIAWVAGFFDGEGCVRIKRQRSSGKIYYQLVVDITQSGENMPNTISKLVDLFGGNPLSSKDKRTNYQRRWSWRLVSGKAENFLRAILPYSIGKREQIILGIKFQERAVGRGSYRNIALQEEFYQCMSKLKHYIKQK